MERETFYRDKREQPFAADLIEIADCKMKKEMAEHAQIIRPADGEYSFVRSMSGSGSLNTSDQTYMLQPNDALLLKTADIKSWCAGNGNWEFVQYRFIPFGRVPFFAEKKTYTIPVSREEKLYLKSMFYQKYSEHDYVSAIFSLLLHKLAGICMTSQKQNDEPDAQAVHFAVAYITEHLSENISIRALAEKLHFSERHFRQSFRKVTGRSPKSYQQEARLTKCAFLLTTTTDSVQEISDGLGYGSPYQLSRDFKKKFGVSPSEYRRHTAE